jgi:hypothetical protein
MQHSSPAAVLFAFALTIFAARRRAATIVVNDATDTLQPGCATTGTGTCRCATRSRSPTATRAPT